MTKGNRIAVFAVCVATLAIVYVVVRPTLNIPEEALVVLFSSMLMISFVTLFLEHWFTTPTDVISTTLSILLVLAPIRLVLKDLGSLYILFFLYNLVLLSTSVVSLLLLDSSSPAASSKNRMAAALKRFSVFFGNGRFLYTALFTLILIFFVRTDVFPLTISSIYVGVVLLIDPKKLVLSLPSLRRSGHNDVGQIIGVQGRNTFLAKLHRSHAALHRFDAVDFRYAMDENRRSLRGLIIDNYLLDEQQWIKIISSDEITAVLGGALDAALPDTNVVYQVDAPNRPEMLDRLVGIVAEGSTIGTVKFEYSSRADVSEGAILEAKVRGIIPFYQVIQATTRVEMLESKNEAGIVVGEAVQLGVWDPADRRFDRFGWVPDINAPVFLATSPRGVVPGKGEVSIGQLPGTELPVLMDLNEAVAHHIAILGVTGSGKSVLARKLVRDVSVSGIKVLCVDFTGEYNERFKDLSGGGMIQEDRRNALFSAVDRLSEQLDKWPNQRNKDVMKKAENELRKGFRQAVDTFMSSEQQLAIFELPDVSNTTAILEYTKWFFRALFDIARKPPGLKGRLCVVIEEAHTVIPEWNFIGVDDRRAQAVVNAISQIALQGRKYGVGFIVVAQRTANVSKTVLTQCNSVIAFQQFDKTSSEFLSNYLGNDMVQALPNLKRRQAIAVGKGFRSGVPLIFNVPDLSDL